MRIFFVILVVLWSGTGFCSELETVIHFPENSVEAGQEVSFWLYLHNVDQRPSEAHLPARLACRLESVQTQDSAIVNATREGEEERKLLPPKGFVKERYLFTVPRDIEGPVQLTAESFMEARAMFVVVPTEQVVADATEHAAEQEEGPSFESLFALYQPYVNKISGYEPLYFLVGADPKDSKFQISFKYRLFNPNGSLAQDHPWIQGVHLAYTHTSFWDLRSDSAPFEDTSYKPEIFLLSSNISPRSDWIDGFFLQTGFQHESNGRGGERSHSTNMIYLEPILMFYDADSRYGFQLSPKVWAYVHNDDDNNSDLADYRGYFELEAKLGNADGFVLESNLRWAQEGASVQLDLTYPVHRFFNNNVDLYLHLQYANALAESLLEYQERTQALRIGFSIVR